MYTADALRDLHERTHRNLQDLLVHCRKLTEEELNREIPGFGYSTVRLQIHHEIGAQEYWIGVIQGAMYVEENDADYPTVASLEAYRKQVHAMTDGYLKTAAPEELNTARKMITWRKEERLLTPARVVMRTLTHLYHHQGQVVAMCRLLGKPTGGLDFPLD